MQVVSAPRNVMIAITGRCNLSCQYCFYADEMVAHGDLPTERWIEFLEELGDLGVMDVTFTGGEVFTRRDLFELIDAATANRMRYGLLSNGTLITEKVLSQFEVGKRRQRLNSIQISIDGSTAEIHNLSRPNSFDRAMRGLRLLVENGFPVTVRVTLNRYNVDDLENLARLLLEDIGLSGFGTNEAFPMGSAKCQGGNITLTRELRLKAMRILTELNERYDGRISAQAGPLAMANQLAKIKEYMARGETSMPGCGTMASCGGVFSKLDIQHDGTIVPCHMLPTFQMGKIGEVDLGEVWQCHPAMDELRERRDIPLQTLESCRDCPYVGFCTGGCPGMVVNATEQLYAYDPAACYRILLGEELP